jgi:hypothetical protein
MKLTLLQDIFALKGPTRFNLIKKEEKQDNKGIKLHSCLRFGSFFYRIDWTNYEVRSSLNCF